MKTFNTINFIFAIVTGILLKVMLLLCNTLHLIIVKNPNKTEYLKLSNIGPDYTKYLVGLIASLFASTVVFLHLLFSFRVLNNKFLIIIICLLLITGGILMIFYMNKIINKINTYPESGQENIIEKDFNGQAQVIKEQKNIKVMEILGYLSAGFTIILAFTTTIGMLLKNKSNTKVIQK